jgi:glucokinase
VALTIGVDVGGTKVLAGVVTEEGAVLATQRRATPSQNAADTAEVIMEVVRQLQADYTVEAVGVGAAGWIDSTRSVVLHAPNLAWRNEPLRTLLEASLDLPVVVENDANTATWAEYRFGAGRGENHLVMVTVGTGIGGGIVLDGSLYRGAFGIAGEFGHVRVVVDGLPCGCGDHGCWEQYASGRALVREARDGARHRPEAAKVLLQLAGDNPEAILGAHVTAAAGQGDVVALQAFAVVGEWLGRGLADLVSGWDPGCILLGGGVSDAGALLLDPTLAAYEKAVRTRGRLRTAQLRLAALGNIAGLVGAADLARLRD